MKMLVENINRILSLMLLEKKDEEVELDESDILEDEEGGGASSGGASTGYPSIEKWETGVARGPANSLGGKKEDKVTRGKGNMLGKAGEKWSSGRTFGKTGKYKT